eukprot:m.6976 g.6976  ORF g.6976 m.6976 type:complete len:205 (-) comp4911_c0_seq1:22-636(-)
MEDFKFQRPGEDEQASEERLNKMKAAVTTLLECLGEDPRREGLLDTPRRVAYSLEFLTRGSLASPNATLQTALFAEPHRSDIVIVKDIDFFSLCEHHMLPFHGKIHVAYLPGTHIVGLSKVGRLVETVARRLQVQERLTQQVADAMAEVLQPRGVLVLAEAKHMCMSMRGVEKADSVTVTSAATGVLSSDAAARAEALAMLNRR